MVKQYAIDLQIDTLIINYYVINNYSCDCTDAPDFLLQAFCDFDRFLIQPHNMEFTKF